MNTYQLTTNGLNVDAAESFLYSVQTSSAYYIFAAKSTPYANNSDQVITLPQDSVKAGIHDVYDNMIFGKKLSNTDAALMTVRHDWITGSTYDMYDDQDPDLYTKPFYACVNAGSQYHVYKCLNNNRGAVSVTEPTGTDPNAFETPVDGYVWKYLYTANDYTMSKFSTNEYIPVTPNTAVQANAVSGTIEVIKIEDGGIGYDNYVMGEFSTSSDIKVLGNPLHYALSAGASSTDNFYNNCLIKITSGAAANEYRLINQYFIDSNTGRKIIVINEEFDNTIVATDTYEIYPNVFVFDTGAKMQVNCIARAIVSGETGNSITKVEVFNPGSGYRSANVVVLPDPVVGVTSNASLRAIISPPGGHGSDVVEELGAGYVGLSTKFVENESPLSAENDYRTIGLIKEPLFANVRMLINAANTVGNFIVGERVYQYTPTYLTGTANLYSNSTVAGVNTLFGESLTAGDTVLITDGTQNIFANVASISNNTLMTLTSNALFSNSNCTVALVRNFKANGIVTSATESDLYLTDFSAAGWTSSTLLVGHDSSCTASLNTSVAEDERITINGRYYDQYKKYTQLTRLIGQLNTGAFVEDEEVTQDSAVAYSQPSAYVHSFVENGSDDVLYITDVRNMFQTAASPDSDGVVVGSTGGAQFTVSSKYDGDLVSDSGEIMYLENLSPISRSNTQTETIKLIIKF